MALRLLPARLLPARQTLPAVRTLAQDASAPPPCEPTARPLPQDACTPPPCTPAARPPCRASTALPAAGLRVACCSPSSSARPPCARPVPPSPRTCSDAAPVDGLQRCAVPGDAAASGVAPGACGARLDLVARRLAAAESVRREDYEREVAARESCAPPPRRPYRLAGARETLRATDGQRYSVWGAPAPGHCGPGREAPPPRAVLVEPFDACRPSLVRRPDPCAHRPKIFLEVDRTAVPPPPATPTAAPPAPRLVETRSAADLLRRFASVGRSAPQDASGRRRLHTEAKASESSRSCSRPGDPVRSGTDPPDIKSDGNSLEDLLRERERLAEAARGRSVAAERGERGGAGGGGLELRVPPSAEAVRVRVLLDFAGAAPARARPCTARAPDARALCSTRGACGPDSWLSIKNLQKKIAEGWRDVESQKAKKRSEESSGAPAARPPDVAACPPAARPPGAAACPPTARPPGDRCGPCGSSGKSSDRSRCCLVQDLLVVMQ